MMEMSQSLSRKDYPRDDKDKQVDPYYTSDPQSSSPSINSNRPSFMIFLVVLLIFVDYLCSRILPSVPTIDPTFDVKVARNNLIELTSYGSKSIGSEENEIITPNMLLWMLNDIKKTALPHVNIDIQLQHVSGHFYESFLGGINNVYGELTNVVVRVNWPNSDSANLPKQRALLINAHFDSYPGSPGASDDVIGGVCMIEVLRHLSKSKDSLRNPLILLFNGGEEAHQPAAHGFISQHEWAQEVKYLINLEAVGSGGKEMVFQSNSGWLMEQYGSAVPHPHATVIGSELFRNLLNTVSATDWSTFIEFGPKDILGIDTAYVENGYVYHTSFDKETIITDGTIINTYENLLAITKKLCDTLPPSATTSYGATNKNGEELAVFYDVLQMFYVSYSGLMVINLHVAALLFGVFTLRHLSSHNYRLTVSSHNLMGLVQSKFLDQVVYIPLSFQKIRAMLFDELLCVFAPIVAGSVTGICVYILCPMRWYAGGIVVASLLYVPPCVLSALYVRGYVAGRSHSDFAIRQIAAISMWIFLLAVSMYFQIMSGYICCWWIVCSCCASLCYHFAVKVYPVFPTESFNSSRSSRSAMYTVLNYLTRPDNIYSLFMFPAIIVWVQIIRSTMGLVLPLLGKSGTVVPPDPVVGALMGLLVGVTSGTTLANSVQKPMDISFFRRSITFIAVVVAVLMVFTSPYTVDRPKRMWLHHIGRAHFAHGPVSTFSAASDSLVTEPFAAAVPGPVKRALLDEDNARSHVHHLQHNHKRGSHLRHNTSTYEPQLPIVATPVVASKNSSNSTDKKSTAINQRTNVTVVSVTQSSATSSGGAVGSLPLTRAMVYPHYESLVGASVDYGLWAGGIDGLATTPFGKAGVKALDGRHYDKGYCDVWDGSCYFKFPWYFPVATALRGLHFIPLSGPPAIPQGNRLNAEWNSSPLTTTITTTTESASGKTAHRVRTMRRIRIHISGPDHMAIVLRDSALGSRVKSWYINAPTKSDSKVGATTAARGVEDSTAVNQNLDDATITSRMQQPTPVRPDDGCFFFQFEFGSCPQNICRRTLYVDVIDDIPIDVAVYGHYLTLSESEEIVRLKKQLPDWAIGAEWTNFPSFIISGSI